MPADGSQPADEKLLSWRVDSLESYRFALPLKQLIQSHNLITRCHTLRHGIVCA
jgi:hypothetical protein